LAELAGVDDRLRLGDRRHEQLVVGAHQGDARLLDGVAHLHRLLGAQAQRLLAQDVLAGLGGGHDRGAVQVVRQADVHRVDLRILDQLEEVGVAGGAGLGGARGEGLGVGVGDGDHAGAVGDRGVAREVGRGDAAGADEADADGQGDGHGDVLRWWKTACSVVQYRGGAGVVQVAGGTGQRAALFAATTSSVSARARWRFSSVRPPLWMASTHWAKGAGASAGTGISSHPSPVPRRSAEPSLNSTEPSVPWISMLKGLTGLTNPVSITPIAPSGVVTVTVALSSTPRPVMSV